MRVGIDDKTIETTRTTKDLLEHLEGVGLLGPYNLLLLPLILDEVPDEGRRGDLKECVEIYAEKMRKLGLKPLHLYEVTRHREFMKVSKHSVL